MDTKRVSFRSDGGDETFSMNPGGCALTTVDLSERAVLVELCKGREKAAGVVVGN